MLFVPLSPHPLSSWTYCSGDSAGDTHVWQPWIHLQHQDKSLHSQQDSLSLHCQPQALRSTKVASPSTPGRSGDTPTVLVPIVGLGPRWGSMAAGLNLLKDRNSAPLQETRAGQGSLPLLVGSAGGKQGAGAGLGCAGLGWAPLTEALSPSPSACLSAMPADLQCTPQHPRDGGPAPVWLPCSSGCTGEQSGGSMAPGRHRTCHCPSMGMAAWGQAELAPGTRLGGEGDQSSPGWEGSAELPRLSPIQVGSGEGDLPGASRWPQLQLLEPGHLAQVNAQPNPRSHRNQPVPARAVPCASRSRQGHPRVA